MSHGEIAVPLGGSLSRLILAGSVRLDLGFGRGQILMNVGDRLVGDDFFERFSRGGHLRIARIGRVAVAGSVAAVSTVEEPAEVTRRVVF